MENPIFCCASAHPYRIIRTDHDPKFAPLVAIGREWNDTSMIKSEADTEDCATLLDQQGAFVVQIVRQVNFGPRLSTLYLAPIPDAMRSDAAPDVRYQELPSEALIRANYSKVNTYKNFRCDVHQRFFEFNLYQRDPVNSHHWRMDLARPAGEIDLGRA